MSVLDLPRLHFRGLCRVHAPTGNANRAGHIDSATNTVYLDGIPYPAGAPASVFHGRLAGDGPRFGADGLPDPAGIFNGAAGWDLEGNGHCSWEGVAVVGAQTSFGLIETEQARDPIIGSLVDLWGHYNEYLGTTFNRARWVELDPSSRWTNQVLAGQVTIGRRASSVDVPWQLSAAIEKPHAARCRKRRHIDGLAPHVWAAEFARAELFQFSVRKETIEWRALQAADSPVLRAFARALEDDEVSGLAFQYRLSNMSAPTRPNTPVFLDLAGTAGLWRRGEMATFPAGRLLVPADPQRQPTLGNVLVHEAAQGLSINLALAFGRRGRSAVAAGSGPAHALGPLDEVGDIELRAGDRVLARVPAARLADAIDGPGCGVVDVPHLPPAGHGLAVADPLSIHADGLLLHVEQEWVVQADDSTLSLEMPDRRQEQDHRVEVPVRSFHRGRPAASAIDVRAFWNPHGLPAAASSSIAATPPQVIELRAGRAADDGSFAPSATLRTDAQGEGWLTLRGVAPGGARLWLSPAGRAAATPLVADANLEAAIANYDNDDQLGFWSREGSLHVRVLPDDWHLDEVPEDTVDFAFLYEHVLAYYELVYPFMKALVFSLADECKCETYARLMWQMCDPRNRDKTYYMPPTRELSLPKSRLFLKYLRNVEPRVVLAP